MATDKELVAGDHGDDVESVEDEEKDEDIADKILKFPNVMAALQSQHIAEMLANLPPSVKRRIKALKKLQLEATNIEAKFFKEVHELECKYHKLYVPLYEKREKVVNGTYEPTEEEAQWPSDSESDNEEEIAKELKEKAKIENKNNIPDDVKGIPDFWLTIFKNCNILAEMVQPHDEPILKHLIDIKSTCQTDPMSFTLDFHFSPNEYFTNTVLTKEYIMQCTPDEDDPFSFEGPEIYKCTGCTINWNKGKNVTVKTIKKKQKHKSRGVVRMVTKTVPNDSFFNFFSPPAVPENAKNDDVDEDVHNILTSDFEIGHYIRERIIPKAILYFTGEGIDDEEDFDEEEDEEDDEEEENESDGGGKDPKANDKEQNCKQQ